MLFKGFPDECDALKLLKRGVQETRSSVSWETEWEANAMPLITKVKSTSLLKLSLCFTNKINGKGHILQVISGNF